MSVESEKKYLIDLINTVIFDENRLKVMVSNEKYLGGMISSSACENNPLSELAQYRTIYTTVFDLNKKIRWSLLQAVSFAYSDNVMKHWGMLESSSDEEDLAYYFIENAVYRTISLWDMLAQFYRLLYEIDIDKTQLYYKPFFNQDVKKEKHRLKDEALNLNEIKNYINQADDTDTYGEWKGNHTFVRNIRHKLVHRNEPNVTTFSDFDINIKHHPTYMLKRICEDYAMVCKFLDEVVSLIENEEMHKLKSLLET